MLLTMDFRADGFKQLSETCSSVGECKKSTYGIVVGSFLNCNHLEDLEGATEISDIGLREGMV
jgi:hypothetical protein